MIFNDDVNLNEGSETPRALLGQIFSTLFNIAAWVEQWVGGGGQDHGGGGRDDGGHCQHGGGGQHGDGGQDGDGGHGQHGGGGQEQDDGGDQNSLVWKPAFWGESWSSSAKSDKDLVHLFSHSLS